MQLIADSGSTKVDWRALFDSGEVISISTEGINPVFMEDEYIIGIFKEHLLPVVGKDVTGEDVQKIWFYGAGVVGDEIREKLNRCFKAVFPESECFTASDVLAAARALCGHSSGIASILGTGSNSCFYDGEDIVKNVRAGGFILGDEASGAYLGKRLVSDFIKGLLPEAIENEFIKRYNLDYPAIVQKVYREQLPSRFLASFSPFIYEFRNHPHIASLIRSSFEEFLKRNIVHYEFRKYPINFVGSIAFYYKDLLEQAVRSAGMRMGKVLKSPIDGLIQYHKEQ